MKKNFSRDLIDQIKTNASYSSYSDREFLERLGVLWGFQGSIKLKKNISSLYCEQTFEKGRIQLFYSRSTIRGNAELTITEEKEREDFIYPSPLSEQNKTRIAPFLYENREDYLQKKNNELQQQVESGHLSRAHAQGIVQREQSHQYLYNPKINSMNCLVNEIKAQLQTLINAMDYELLELKSNFQYISEKCIFLPLEENAPSIFSLWTSKIGHDPIYASFDLQKRKITGLSFRLENIFSEKNFTVNKPLLIQEAQEISAQIFIQEHGAFEKYLVLMFADYFHDTEKLEEFLKNCTPSIRRDFYHSFFTLKPGNIYLQYFEKGDMFPLFFKAELPKQGFYPQTYFHHIPIQFAQKPNSLYQCIPMVKIKDSHQIPAPVCIHIDAETGSFCGLSTLSSIYSLYPLLKKIQDPFSSTPSQTPDITRYREILRQQRTFLNLPLKLVRNVQSL